MHVSLFLNLQFEQKNSAVECYMKEYGATEEEAKMGLHRQLGDAWKDINASFLLPTAATVVPLPLLTGILNLACVMDVVYKHEDGYTTHHGTVLKDFIVSTLVQPVPV
jgi:(-)-germacrene D synthase